MSSINDGKEVKSNQTSSLKGKTQYIEIYKSLESLLNDESELPERTRYLCEAWRAIHTLCQHATPTTHPHLLGWLLRHTARTVLQSEWQSPKSKDEHSNLTEAIDLCIEECQLIIAERGGNIHSWETQLLQRADWFKSLLSSPWEHPVLKVLLDPRGQQLTDEEVLQWLKEERSVMFVTRLRQLVASKCDDLAMSLVSAVMNRVRAGSTSDTAPSASTSAAKPELKKPTFADILKTHAGFTEDVWEIVTDIEFVLLHKRERSRCIELAKQTPLGEGYKLVERLRSRLETSPREKKLWKNAKDVATLIAQMLIARCMVIPLCTGVSRVTLYCCTRSLVRLVSPERLRAETYALAALAVTARHLHTFAAAVDAQCEDNMKPFVCELYVRAITAGMNELERLKLKTEKESEARTAEQTLASWFTQLGDLLSQSARMKCECTLTAFSVHPSQAMYDRIKAAPVLPPISMDSHEPKQETNSEFGSWANDSHSQTNFVKTSQTLNLKHTQQQANVLSTAILTEGETIGLGAELCQDLAVLLSGPRLKTLSWDMNRQLLLQNCRSYMERTHGGTRALTTELKYLNLDPKAFQHLPEEDDDDNDIYYGIEKGYEHLVEITQEPEEIWQDVLLDPYRTDSGNSSTTDDMYTIRKKKKSKHSMIMSDEDSDPLRVPSYSRGNEKRSERPHSKETSKEHKKKTKSQDRDYNQEKEKSQTKDKQEKNREKKERKKKEKSEKDKIEQAANSLSNFIGMKVIKIEDGEKKVRKKKERRRKDQESEIYSQMGSATDSDYNNQGKAPLTLLNSEESVFFNNQFSIGEINNSEKNSRHGSYDTNLLQHNVSGLNGPVKCNRVHENTKPESSKTEFSSNKNEVSKTSNYLTGLKIMNYPTDRRADSKMAFGPSGHSQVNKDVRNSIKKLLQFRRQMNKVGDRKKTNESQGNSKIEHFLPKQEINRSVSKLECSPVKHIPIVLKSAIGIREDTRRMPKNVTSFPVSNLRNADPSHDMIAIDNSSLLASTAKKEIQKIINTPKFSTTTNSSYQNLKILGKTEPKSSPTLGCLRQCGHNSGTSYSQVERTICESPRVNESVLTKPTQSNPIIKKLYHQNTFQFNKDNLKHGHSQHRIPQKTYSKATASPQQISYQDYFIKQLQNNTNSDVGAKELTNELVTKRKESERVHTHMSFASNLIKKRAEIVSPSCARSMSQHCKIDKAPNTFARLSYLHKSKQNEAKPKRLDKVPDPNSLHVRTDGETELNRHIADHTFYKMKYLQKKGLVISRLETQSNIEPKENPQFIQNNLEEQVKPVLNLVKENPLLSNILEKKSIYPENTIEKCSTLKTYCIGTGIEPLVQTNVLPTTSSSQNTSLSEKDQQDLIHLLRQQSKLNAPILCSKSANNTLSKSSITSSSVTTYQPVHKNETYYKSEPVQQCKIQPQLNITQHNIQTCPMSNTSLKRSEIIINCDVSKSSPGDTDSKFNMTKNIETTPNVLNISESDCAEISIEAKLKNLTDNDISVKVSGGKIQQNQLLEKSHDNAVSHVRNLMVGTPSYALHSNGETGLPPLGVTRKADALEGDSKHPTNSINVKQQGTKYNNNKQQDWEKVMNAILAQKTPCRSGPSALEMALRKDSQENTLLSKQSMSSVAYKEKNKDYNYKQPGLSSDKDFNHVEQVPFIENKGIKNPCTLLDKKSNFENNKVKESVFTVTENAIARSKSPFLKNVVDVNIQNISKARVPENFIQKINKPSVQPSGPLKVSRVNKNSRVSSNDVVGSGSVKITKISEQNKADIINKSTRLVNDYKNEKKHSIPLSLKESNPLLSGIPNSDYDLIEELMDDDLRQEIGELSSDEESYRSSDIAALKSNNRVTDFNTDKSQIANSKCLTIDKSKIIDKAKKNLIIEKLNSGHDSSFTYISTQSSLKSIYKSGPQFAKSEKTRNISSQIPKSCASKSLTTEDVIVQKTNVIHSITKTNVPSFKNNDVKINMQNKPVESGNLFFAPVHQQPRLQKVVLITPELVYNRCPQLQAEDIPVNTNIHDFTINNEQNLTLLQTTQYATSAQNPIIIGSTITVPILSSNVSSSSAGKCQPLFSNKFNLPLTTNVMHMESKETLKQFYKSEKHRELSVPNFEDQNNVQREQKKTKTLNKSTFGRNLKNSELVEMSNNNNNSLNNRQNVETGKINAANTVCQQYVEEFDNTNLFKKHSQQHEPLVIDSNGVVQPSQHQKGNAVDIEPNSYKSNSDLNQLMQNSNAMDYSTHNRSERSVISEEKDITKKKEFIEKNNTSEQKHILENSSSTETSNVSKPLLNDVTEKNKKKMSKMLSIINRSINSPSCYPPIPLGYMPLVKRNLQNIKRDNFTVDVPDNKIKHQLALEKAVKQNKKITHLNKNSKQNSMKCVTDTVQLNLNSKSAPQNLTFSTEELNVSIKEQKVSNRKESVEALCDGYNKVTENKAMTRSTNQNEEIILNVDNVKIENQLSTDTVALEQSPPDVHKNSVPNNCTFFTSTVQPYLNTKSVSKKISTATKRKEKHIRGKVSEEIGNSNKDSVKAKITDSKTDVVKSAEVLNKPIYLNVEKDGFENKSRFSSRSLNLEPENNKSLKIKLDTQVGSSKSNHPVIDDVDINLNIKSCEDIKITSTRLELERQELLELEMHLKISDKHIIKNKKPKGLTTQTLKVDKQEPSHDMLENEDDEKSAEKELQMDVTNPNNCEVNKNISDYKAAILISEINKLDFNHDVTIEENTQRCRTPLRPTNIEDMISVSVLDKRKKNVKRLKNNINSDNHFIDLNHRSFAKGVNEDKREKLDVRSTSNRMLKKKTLNHDKSNLVTNILLNDTNKIPASDVTDKLFDIENEILGSKISKTPITQVSLNKEKIPSSDKIKEFVQIKKKAKQKVKNKNLIKESLKKIVNNTFESAEMQICKDNTSHLFKTETFTQLKNKMQDDSEEKATKKDECLILETLDQNTRISQNNNNQDFCVTKSKNENPNRKDNSGGHKYKTRSSTEIAKITLASSKQINTFPEEMVVYNMENLYVTPSSKVKELVNFKDPSIKKVEIVKNVSMEGQTFDDLNIKSNDNPNDEVFETNETSNSSLTKVNYPEIINLTDDLSPKKNHSKNISCDTISMVAEDKNANVREYDLTDDSDVQCFKDSIKIEEIPTRDKNPLKRLILIKLPNDKTFKVSVFGKLDVNFDTLFADPQMKSILLDSMKGRKRYTLCIKQPFVNYNYKKAIETTVKNLSAKSQCMETVDLISDDEDESVNAINIDINSNTHLNDNTILERRNLLADITPVVCETPCINDDSNFKRTLTNLKEEYPGGRPLNMSDSKCEKKDCETTDNMSLHTESALKINSLSTLHTDPGTSVSSTILGNLMSPVTPSHETITVTSSLPIKSIENNNSEILSINSNNSFNNEALQDKMIEDPAKSEQSDADIIEIDDSSSDSLQLTSTMNSLLENFAENNKPEEKICELKNLLLQELGIDESIKKSEINKSSDSLKINEEQHLVKKCYVRMERCDDLLRNNMDLIGKMDNDLLPVDVGDDKCLSRSGSLSILNDFSLYTDDISYQQQENEYNMSSTMANHKEMQSDAWNSYNDDGAKTVSANDQSVRFTEKVYGRTSPLMEIFDTIVLLRNKTLLYTTSNSQKPFEVVSKCLTICDAEWHLTKQKLRDQSKFIKDVLDTDIKNKLNYKVNKLKRNKNKNLKTFVEEYDEDEGYKDNCKVPRLVTILCQYFANNILLFKRRKRKIPINRRADNKMPRISESYNADSTWDVSSLNAIKNETLEHNIVIDKIKDHEEINYGLVDKCVNSNESKGVFSKDLAAKLYMNCAIKMCNESNKNNESMLCEKANKCNIDAEEKRHSVQYINVVFNKNKSENIILRDNHDQCSPELHETLMPDLIITNKVERKGSFKENDFHLNTNSSYSDTEYSKTFVENNFQIACNSVVADQKNQNVQTTCSLTEKFNNVSLNIATTSDNNKEWDVITSQQDLVSTSNILRSGNLLLTGLDSSAATIKRNRQNDYIESKGACNTMNLDHKITQDNIKHESINFNECPTSIAIEVPCKQSNVEIIPLNNKCQNNVFPEINELTNVNPTLNVDTVENSIQESSAIAQKFRACIDSRGKAAAAVNNSDISYDFKYTENVLTEIRNVHNIVQKSSSEINTDAQHKQKSMGDNNKCNHGSKAKESDKNSISRLSLNDFSDNIKILKISQGNNSSKTKKLEENKECSGVNYIGSKKWLDKESGNSTNNSIIDNANNGIVSREVKLNKTLDEKGVLEPLISLDSKQEKTLLYEYDKNVILKGVEYEDPVVGTCYVFPIIVADESTSSENILNTSPNAIPLEINSRDEISIDSLDGNSHKDIEFNVILPKETYARKKLKRKMDMSNIREREKKYRKGKNIDNPKLTYAAISESAYKKEYVSLIDYYSSIKFSYSRPFLKENFNVANLLKNWPVLGNNAYKINEEEIDNNLFADLETTSNSKIITDPLKLTLAEEITRDSNESYWQKTPNESNSHMGFGEGSGRVIQNLESVDDVSKFSAATLSDVKRPRPFLLSENLSNSFSNYFASGSNEDQIDKIKRYLTYIKLRDKVRSFFKKTSFELTYDFIQEQLKKEHETKCKQLENICFPFEFCKPDYIDLSPMETVVQVVQVGQLPVSAAAQNPVTCDPRVTQVVDANAQFSVENSLNDESQSFKTEYTELTTADLSLPVVQEYVQQNPTSIENQELNKTTGDQDRALESEIKSGIQLGINEQINPIVSNNLPIANTQMKNAQYHFERNNLSSLRSDGFKGLEQNSSTNRNLPQQKQHNGSTEKTDQIAHAMNAAGITMSSENLTNTRGHALVNILTQKIRQGIVNTSQSSPVTYPKVTSINAVALQQALAQILPPPLNESNTSDNNQHSQTSVTPQVLHIVQGKNNSGKHIALVDNSHSTVISTGNSTQVLHIVQNKSASTSVSATNASLMPQSTSLSGLSLVDAGLQQGGNHLLHILNTGNQKNSNTAHLLKRVNLLTNLTNVQGANEQKMVQFVCKSADGKSIQLNAPHHRSMVLRIQPIEAHNIQAPPSKSIESQNANPTPNSNSMNTKENSALQQEIKSRSIYEENYAKFIQNSSNKSLAEKSTSLPKFNQAFGKPVFEESNQKNEINGNNSHLTPANGNANTENTDCQPSANLDRAHISPPLLLKKVPVSTSLAQTTLIQQIKQTIAPMNIQTMHGGVIYTRQIPVNIGAGQTINLITVPSTELKENSNLKQSELKYLNKNEVEPSIIKIVPQTTSSPEVAPEGSERSSNENRQTSAPQPVLTQMRIKLPMLSKTPQMVPGARVMRPSFFQIQRNVIGGANQPVYQQLVLTAAPPLGQQMIRIPQTQTSRIKVSTDNQSETQMSTSTLEQLREFDMVLEQVKERSTVQPSSNSNSSFNKIHVPSTDSSDGQVTANTVSAESTQQVLYSIGNNHSLNVAYVNRKATVVTPVATTFARSPDSSGMADSPTSSTHIQISGDSTSENSPTKSLKFSLKTKPKPKSSASNPPNTLKINTVPPKTPTQKPLEDEQTTQRILYILAEYKEQVENSPDKDKPAPRRRSNPPTNPSGTSKRKKSSNGSKRSGTRDLSPIHGEDTSRTLGSEDSSCGTSQGECAESCLESQSPQDSPRKVARKLTFENEIPTAQQRPQPQRNVVVAEGQTITVARGSTGKATAVLMPGNYILPVSMVKGGQQIAIVTNRGPKILTVGGGEGATTNTLLLQRLIGPAGLKPVLTRPGIGVRHLRLPTTTLHNFQTFNLAATTPVQPPPESGVSPASSTTSEHVETRQTSSLWAGRDREKDLKQNRNTVSEGPVQWNLHSSRDYTYEEPRTENVDRTVLDPISDRYSPDIEAQRIFDKMFDVDSKKSYVVGSHDETPRCTYDIDASDCEDKPYHQVVQKKEGTSHRQHRFSHVSSSALRHKYAMLDHELGLQKSLSEECEDLGVDSPSASELFPEAELLFAASPAHEHAHDHGHHVHSHTPLMNQTCISQPDMDDQIATDHLIRAASPESREELDVNLGLGDVGIVTLSRDGRQATLTLDQEEFARSHPNTTFHREPTEEQVQPFTLTGHKGRTVGSTIYHHTNTVPATVLMTAPQTTVISQASPETSSVQSSVKYTDINSIINRLPNVHGNHSLNLSLAKDEGLTRYENVMTDPRELDASNTASAIVHAAGNATQVIRRVCFDDKRVRETRFPIDQPEKKNRNARFMPDGLHATNAADNAKNIAEESARDASLEFMPEASRFSPERHSELFWESNSTSEKFESRRHLDFSSDSDKCCKSPFFDENNSTDSSGVGSRIRFNSVIKEARSRGRRGSADGSSADDTHPPLRTYPPKRMHLPMQRSTSGKTRAGERCPDSIEVRRRASVRGVVKRGCHCCNGSPNPSRPKKPRHKKPGADFTSTN